MRKFTPEEIRNSFFCKDCGKDTYRTSDYYMVKHELWKTYGIPVRGAMLCLSCLETRMGRAVTFEDLLHAPINILNPRFTHLFTQTQIDNAGIVRMNMIAGIRAKKRRLELDEN